MADQGDAVVETAIRENGNKAESNVNDMKESPTELEQKIIRQIEVGVESNINGF